MWLRMHFLDLQRLYVFWTTGLTTASLCYSTTIHDWQYTDKSKVSYTWYFWNSKILYVPCMKPLRCLYILSLTTKIDHTNSADTSKSKNILQMFRDVGMAGLQKVRKRFTSHPYVLPHGVAPSWHSNIFVHTCMCMCILDLRWDTSICKITLIQPITQWNFNKGY